ncbi:acetyl-CoA synthetase-like protein [Teratosphaeria nubilosa]|uniref:Acetyl-CoA synthetase-like protein n=1 Tax=Teratosphaeria nubilosa TaxID=161662 RepID=A0A6G1LAL2_9PEZI|nr:acetyl-CoA synthetase-like protein [Teratosphaeria nubilosa]
MAPLQRTPFFDAIEKHDPESISVVHSLSGRTFRYGSLLHDVAANKDKLLQELGKTQENIHGERIAFIIENSYDYVVTLLTCLASNAVAVPLAPGFPPTELRYSLNQSEACALVTSTKYKALGEKVVEEGLEHNIKHVVHAKIEKGADTQGSIQWSGSSDQTDGGMMLYTSGTTARPKGVLLHTSVLAAQAKSLTQAWEYTPRDRLLHVLPLHHIHGTVNAMLTPLMAGSSIELMFPFNVDNVWKRFAAPFLPQKNGHSNGDANGFTQPQQKAKVTFFTVVPTIWARMLQSHPQLSRELQEAADEAIKRENLRLNISGSAALPTPTKDKWTKLSSGNVLLERYGMTEVGMALSCGLTDADRIDGSVGWPLPSVEARLVDPDTKQLIEVGQDVDAEGKEGTGEIQLRGPTIFKGYWRNEEATKKEFTDDGWFKTGDIAIRKEVKGTGTGSSGSWAKGPAYFIRGRASADIIKTGGEKVSALEIERELLGLPEVKECAVVALPSEAWGQKVAAVIVLSEQGETAGKGGKPWSAMDMRRALNGKLVAYKIPQDMKTVEEIPRNAMGKVNKKDLVSQVFGGKEEIRRRSVDVAEERKRAKGQAGPGAQR